MPGFLESFKDLIAARCDRRMRDLKVEANEIMANRLREQITHGAREKLERMAYDAGYGDMRVHAQDVEKPVRGDGDIERMPLESEALEGSDWRRARILFQELGTDTGRQLPSRGASPT